jgi:hypothetical protein
MPTALPVPTPVAGPAPRAAPVPKPIPALQPVFLDGVGIHLGPGFNFAQWYWPHFAEANVKTFRMDFHWAWIEKQKGQYVIDGSLTGIDNFLLTAHDKGIAPLIILDYGNPLYDGGGFPMSEAGQIAFANYAAFLASRYKGAVKYYEVWNEWSGGGTRTSSAAEAYARLLSKVRAALKAVDPAIVVLGGAVSGTDDGWVDMLFSKGTLQNLDGFSVHPYVYPDIPEKALEWLSRVETRAKTAAGGRDVPIYVTEIGWPTFTGADGVSSSTAADYLARFYLLAPMYSFIRGSWWYDFLDDGNDRTNIQHNFGLYHGDTPKPAACAMSYVSKLHDAYQAVSARRDANGVWIAKYSNGATSIFAIWTQDPGATVNATLSTRSPAGAGITAQGICRNANVPSGNGSTLLHAVISNSPTILTTIGDDILIQ